MSRQLLGPFLRRVRHELEDQCSPLLDRQIASELVTRTCRRRRWGTRSGGSGECGARYGKPAKRGHQLSNSDHSFGMARGRRRHGEKLTSSAGCSGDSETQMGPGCMSPNIPRAECITAADVVRARRSKDQRRPHRSGSRSQRLRVRRDCSAGNAPLGRRRRRDPRGAPLLAHAAFGGSRARLPAGQPAREHQPAHQFVEHAHAALHRRPPSMGTRLLTTYQLVCML